MRRRSDTLATRRKRRATGSVSSGSNRSTERRVWTDWRTASRVPTIGQDRSMTPTPKWDGTYATTRAELHRVAAHVLARRRFALTGRFGLRVTPGGFGTPLFGDDEVVRVDGTSLLRERRVDDRAVTASHGLVGASLRSLAAFTDVDLDAEFSAGGDTPALGDPDALLEIDAASVAAMAEWYLRGAEAVDAGVAELGDAADATVAQLWPEHFDLGIDVAVGAGRTNLGVSPGDGSSAEPYLYVGPWSADRPGDAAYWNASFGALATWSEIPNADAAAAFFARGLGYLAGA